jgi:hypothetical protein
MNVFMSVFIRALVIRHANRIYFCPYIILSSVVCPAVPYFFTLSHKWNDFRENFFGHKKCVFIFSTNFV